MGNKRKVQPAFGNKILGPLDKLFLRKVAAEEVHAEFVTDLSLKTGQSEEELQACLEPLCLCCWQLSRNIIAETEWTGDVNKLREQVKELQEKLAQCNLTSMKDISNLKARRMSVTSITGDSGATSGEEKIYFHEPLAYLDPLMQDLCMNVILDKVDQLVQGDASPELLDKLASAAAARGLKLGQADEEEEESSDEENSSGKVGAGRSPKLRQMEKQLAGMEIMEKQAMQERDRQKQAIEELQRALEESREAEEKSREAVECEMCRSQVNRCEMCYAEIERLGIHLEHCDNAPEEVLRQQSAELASQRLRELESTTEKTETQNQRRPSWQRIQDGSAQTDLTGQILQDLIDASEDLQACYVAAVDAGTHNMHETAEALRKAQSVWLRLWNDALLRGRGIHRRERAPAGPKAVKSVRHARMLPPRPTAYVLPAAPGNYFPLRLLSGDSQDASEDVLEAVVEDETEEELDIQGKQLDSKTSNADDSEALSCPSSPKPKDSQSPQLGPSWIPRPVESLQRRNEPVFQFPKFKRQDRKTVSLALLAPSARTEAEANLRKPLFHLDASGPTEAVPHAHSMRGTEIESVSDFLRHRRQARDVEKQPHFFHMGGQKPECADIQVPTKPFSASRLEKSASSPVLARAA